MSTARMDNLEDLSSSLSIDMTYVVNAIPTALWTYNQAIQNLSSSLNVSSIEDITTGDFRINFADTYTSNTYQVLAIQNFQRTIIDTSSIEVNRLRMATIQQPTPTLVDVESRGAVIGRLT